MTADDLLALPVYEHNGQFFFVVIDEIPEPWRALFNRSLFGCQCPVIEGYENCAYALDWESWVKKTGSEGVCQMALKSFQ